ncbi:MAG: hypothetical protein IJ513_05050 [Bacteroidaceae bacterium]|nr:hypothetical protein [Bacteroidaceae bacterium]
MRKFLLSMALVLCTIGAMAQSTINFTFTRNGENATVNVEGADGVTATIAATSASNAWNTSGAMATATNILCPNTNTSATSESSPITFTLTISGIDVEQIYDNVSYTHVAVNSGGNYQPANDTDIRHCNFILNANGSDLETKTDINIWIPAGKSEKTITFENKEIKANADGTITLKLTLYKGTTNNGCFYGLKNVAITLVEETVEPEPEPELGIFHPSGTNITAAELMGATKPTYIAIKGLANKNSEYWNYVSGEASTSTEYFKQNAIFVWEPVTDGVPGSYYLRKIGNGYMQSSNPGTYAETTEGAAVFTAVKPVEVASGANGELQFNRDANSTTLIANAGGADNLVRFVTGGKWLNIGDRETSQQAPAFNNGYGTFTIYQICELKEFEETLSITIKNIGGEDYATFYSNAPTQIPEGVTAYTITEDGIANGYISLNEIENGATIPANTGIILKTAVEADEEIAITVAGDDVEPLTTNLLKGSAENKDITEEAYVLGIVDGVVGLYKAKMTDGTWLNNAGKAYLPASAVPNKSAAFYGFDWAGTTGIDQITENRVQSTVIYDLTGRRVETISAPGIYIVGGKKVLVK